MSVCETNEYCVIYCIYMQRYGQLKTKYACEYHCKGQTKQNKKNNCVGLYIVITETSDTLLMLLQSDNPNDLCENVYSKQFPHCKLYFILLLSLHSIILWNCLCNLTASSLVVILPLLRELLYDTGMINCSADP